MNLTRLIAHCRSGVCWFVPAISLSLLLGCSSLHGVGEAPQPRSKFGTITGDDITGRLRAGDQIQIRLDTAGTSAAVPASTDVSIDEDGNISLPLIGLIKAALACHQGMATFESAGVSGKA